MDDVDDLLPARYRALVERLPAVIYVNEPDADATTVFVSPQTETILGLPEAAWFNGEWSAHVHPDDAEAMNQKYLEMLEHADIGVDEYRFIRGDGEEIWIHDRVSILRDAQGRPTLVQGMMFDVTEERRAQQVLQQQAAMMAKVDAIARQFDEQLLGGTRLRAVLDTLAEIVGNPVVFEDAAHQLIDYARRGVAVGELISAWEQHARADHERADSDAGCVWRPVRVRDQEWGRIHILALESAVDELDRLALDRAAAAVGLSLLLERDRDQLADRARSDLLADVWQGRWRSARDVLDRMRGLGAHFGEDETALIAMVAELSGVDGSDTSFPQPAARRRALDHLLDATREALAETGTTGMCALVDEMCLMVLAHAGGEGLQRVADAVAVRAAERLPDVGVVIGASRPTRPDHLRTALTEASEAATHGARVVRRPGLHRVDDLGLRQLLGRLGEGPELSRFVESELGPLLASASASADEHLQTVRALMEAGGQKSRAALALHVERRTLYYRLERIERLLQRSLDDPATRLRLEVALQALDVLRARRTPQ